VTPSEKSVQPERVRQSEVEPVERDRGSLVHIIIYSSINETANEMRANRRIYKIRQVPCMRTRFDLLKLSACESFMRSLASTMSSVPITRPKVVCHCVKKCGGPNGVGKLIPYSTHRLHITSDFPATTTSSTFQQFLSGAGSHTSPSLRSSLRRSSPSLDENSGKRAAEGALSDPENEDDIRALSKRPRHHSRDLGVDGRDELDFSGIDLTVPFLSFIRPCILSNVSKYIGVHHSLHQ